LLSVSFQILFGRGPTKYAAPPGDMELLPQNQRLSALQPEVTGERNMKMKTAVLEDSKMAARGRKQKATLL
jgi:hypothetical protein